MCIRDRETAVLLEGSKRKVMKRICSVLIECLQNIAHHAARDQSGQQQSFALLSKHQGFYRLVTGNLILQQDANLIDYRAWESSINSTNLRCASST